MDRARRFDYTRNSMYAFRVGLDSYHGFEGGSQICESEPRDSIILIFMRSLEQWRVRPSHAAECGSRPFLCPKGLPVKCYKSSQSRQCSSVEAGTFACDPMPPVSPLSSNDFLTGEEESEGEAEDEAWRLFKDNGGQCVYTSHVVGARFCCRGVENENETDDWEWQVLS